MRRISAASKVAIFKMLLTIDLMFVCKCVRLNFLCQGLRVTLQIRSVKSIRQLYRCFCAISLTCCAIISRTRCHCVGRCRGKFYLSFTSLIPIKDLDLAGACLQAMTSLCWPSWVLSGLHKLAFLGSSSLRRAWQAMAVDWFSSCTGSCLEHFHRLFYWC